MTIITRQNFLDQLEILINIPSPFSYEQMISKYCKEKLGECGFQVIQDEWGNLMAKRVAPNNILPKKFPMLAAHLDTYNREHSHEYTKEELQIQSYNIRSLISPLKPNQDVLQLEGVHLGFDDKVGVALILCIIMALPDLPLKILFSVQEEHNQNGLRQIPDEFFDDVDYALVLDRMNSSDVIMSYQDYPICSITFAEKIVQLGKEIPLKIVPGGWRADALIIAYGSDNQKMSSNTFRYVTRPNRRVNCVNISTGVYNDHSPGDYCIIQEALAIGNTICHILINWDE